MGSIINIICCYMSLTNPNGYQIQHCPVSRNVFYTEYEFRDPQVVCFEIFVREIPSKFFKLHTWWSAKLGISLKTHFILKNRYLEAFVCKHPSTVILQNICSWEISKSVAKSYTMEYIFEPNCRLQACNYVQKCTPSCMIFIEFAAFLKNRYSEEPLWTDASFLSEI